jgi:Protein of unknown function (DUF1800)
MERWHNNKHQFPLVGRFGDTTTLKNLPPTLLREDIAQKFGSAKAAIINGKVLVCGSPNEVENIVDENSGPWMQGGFDMSTRYNSTSSSSWYMEQKKIVWASQALWAPDQLRQRMAWALSQILVVSPTAGTTDFTESYLSYYDIFVRNAFGNYFDILKEVTYHPLMSSMLTYIDGQSTAYSFVRNNLVTQADENYAREIMQLVSSMLTFIAALFYFGQSNLFFSFTVHNWTYEAKQRWHDSTGRRWPRSSNVYQFRYF